MTPVVRALDAKRIEEAIKRAAGMSATSSPAGSPGQRFIASAAYKRARASGAFEPMGRLPDELQSQTIASEAELRSLLRLRTYADLVGFDIAGVPYTGELPGVARVPSLVENVPVEAVSVLLAQELTEAQQASAVDDGTPLPEAALAFAAPTQQKLPRYGAAEPVALSVLDEPGIVASILDRRIRLGLTLGLENDIINGCGFWPGLLNVAGTLAIAKGVNSRVAAIANGIAAVAAGGWYGPLVVISHPTTWAATHTETDTAGRPLDVAAMFDGKVSEWVLSKAMPVGRAIVADLFASTALFTKGDLKLEMSRLHADFLTRALVQWTLSFRAFAWVRQPAAVAIVTGL